MSRIILIHWKPAEAGSGAERLRNAGHDVDVRAPRGAPDLRQFRDAPPEAFVIDLTHLPSQGRDVGLLLRQQKATRHVPLIFAGGDPEKVARARAVLPDATYTSWPRIETALNKAMARRVETPAVPGVLAGYAGTPLPKKLGISAGSTVALLRAPRGFTRTLGVLPAGARLVRRAGASTRIVILFVTSRRDLDRRLPAAARLLPAGGGLWIAWPKKVSGVPNDLSEAVVRAAGLRAGLVDYKIAAIDDTWAGLKFTRRRAPDTGRSAGWL